VLSPHNIPLTTEIWISGSYHILVNYGQM
jgi:hypothetical protein